MKKTSYVALIFSILLCFSALASPANPRRNISISSLGTINYSSSGQIEFLRQNFHVGWSASKIASVTDVWQGHYDALGAVSGIKASRPDILTLVYFNTIRLWASGPEYIAQRVIDFKNNGWVLKGVSGNYVTRPGGHYYIDFGHSGYHAWLANWYKYYIDQYGLDGASLDNYVCDDNVWYSGVSETPINPRTGLAWTETNIKDAFKAMTLKIREVLGPNKIIIVNGPYNGWRFFNHQALYGDALLHGGIDATMSEGWICENYDASNWVSEDYWKSSIDYAVWLENNFPEKGGKYFMFIHSDNSFASFAGGGNNLPTDMTEAQYNGFALYGYASRLLTVKTLNTMVCFCDYISRSYPQSLFKINMGTPSESYHLLGTSHVYARTFSGGMVLVNPTFNSYTVTIGSGYKNAVTGSGVSSTLTVQPHTGLILTMV